MQSNTEHEYSDVTQIDTANKTYKFSCERCTYKCNNKFSYNKHLSTPKHLKIKSDVENIKLYTCNNCNSTYKHMSSLCKHKRTCTVAPVNSTETSTVNSPTNELVNVITDYIINSEKLQRESIEVNKQLLELYKIMILSHNPDANIN
jgi:hypothetical protein